jgi:hypothetical protein
MGHVKNQTIGTENRGLWDRPVGKPVPDVPVRNRLLLDLPMADSDYDLGVLGGIRDRLNPGRRPTASGAVLRAPCVYSDQVTLPYAYPNEPLINSPGTDGNFSVTAAFVPFGVGIYGLVTSGVFTPGQYSWGFFISTNNVLSGYTSADGTALTFQNSIAGAYELNVLNVATMVKVSIPPSTSYIFYYLNGRFAGGGTVANDVGDIFDPGIGWSIGGDPAGTRLFPGLLAHFCMHGEELSIGEIHELHHFMMEYYHWSGEWPYVVL